MPRYYGVEICVFDERRANPWENSRIDRRKKKNPFILFCVRRTKSENWLAEQNSLPPLPLSVVFGGASSSMCRDIN